MDKIGNRELLYSGEFIVPEGEQVEIYLDIKGWKLKIVVIFNPKGKEQGVTVKPVGDHAEITLTKWDNGLGTCTVKPVELGTHQSGEKVYFTAANYCIGGTNKLTFQALVGGPQ